MSLNYNIQISRCDRINQPGIETKMIVGFTVRNQSFTNSVYIETVLNSNEIDGKDDADCISLAIEKCKDRIDNACEKVVNQTNFLLGTYYEPE